MKRKKIIKIGLIIVIIGILFGGGIGLYMFNMPHRDIQSTQTDYQLQASSLVEEYLMDATTANDKYLDEEGESKILEITGNVYSISEDYYEMKVVLLKSDMDKAGVSFTFTETSNARAESLKIGDIVTLKGVIRSGASYDEDLELYENVLIEKSDVIK